MMAPLKITFHLDGAGLYYDPFEPPTLDGLLAVSFMALVRARLGHVYEHEEIGRDEPPFETPLPLAKWQRGEVWGWHASALMLEGLTAESLTFWRKRLRQDRIGLTQGSPNLTNGIYRDWNMPLPLTLALGATAYCVCDIEAEGYRGYGRRRARGGDPVQECANKIRDQLRRKIKWLGKKRAHGHGRVVGIDVERIDDDYSIERDGRLLRWMPRADGSRLVRPRPPYWNNCGRVACGEIGDPVL